MDLAVILISAGIFTLISKALKQPLILGYILAGFLVGPKFVLFPTVTSVSSVEQWSEIGMIFLMFALGLEFSFKGLLKAGGAALVTAGLKFVGMFLTGVMVGTAIGWSTMESIFLGGLLSMASTTVVIKAYDEMNLKTKPFAPIVFGTLVLEDLIAILLMVLLSTMAVSHNFAGSEMIMNLAKLAFFLILWFLTGIYVIPSALKRARKYLNDEILLIVSIGLCFGMVYLATYVGFSSALGAFMMGSILAETIEGEKIEKLVLNIKNLFGAIFFVSVGMMIDPGVIVEHWAIILLLTIVVIAGHFFFAACGVIFAGKGLSNAVNAGLSLSQLGEFAFIIASLGTTLGVMRGFIYPVVIAVTVITTFTTPYMIKLADPLTRFLGSKLSPKFLEMIEPKAEIDRSSTSVESKAWKKLLLSYFLRIVTYGVVVIAINIISENYIKDILLDLTPNWKAGWRTLVYLIMVIAMMLPFLFMMTNNSAAISANAKILLKQRRSNMWIITSLMLIRLLVAMGIITTVILDNADLSYWTILVPVIFGVIFISAARKPMQRFISIEKRFFNNLNAKETQERIMSPVKTTVRDNLAGYDVQIGSVVLSPDSTLAGKQIKQTVIRRKTGVNIIKIVRGSHSIVVPSGNEFLYPDDKIIVVGSTEQLALFHDMVEKSVRKGEENDNYKFEIRKIYVEEGSVFAHRVLSDFDMRAHNCTVISILRNGEAYTNPDSDFEILPGDNIWFAGTAESFKHYAI